MAAIFFVQHFDKAEQECVVLLGVDGSEGSEFVVEWIPISIHLTLPLFVLYFLALFIAFVAANSRSKGHVGHKSLVNHAQMGAVG
jgi:hypothetical protein